MASLLRLLPFVRARRDRRVSDAARADLSALIDDLQILAMRRPHGLKLVAGAARRLVGKHRAGDRAS